MLRADASKPLAERYVHSIMTGPTGGTLVYTLNPYLLGLIHDARSIHVDTTFRRTLGELKEWEVVMWSWELQHGM
jgi:hypothetical protein